MAPGRGRPARPAAGALSRLLGEPTSAGASRGGEAARPSPRRKPLLGEPQPAPAAGRRGWRAGAGAAVFAVAVFFLCRPAALLSAGAAREGLAATAAALNLQGMSPVNGRKTYAVDEIDDAGGRDEFDDGHGLREPEPLEPYCGRIKKGWEFHTAAEQAFAACLAGQAAAPVGALATAGEASYALDAVAAGETCLTNLLVIGAGRAGTSTLLELLHELPGDVRAWVAGEQTGVLAEKLDKAPQAKFLTLHDAHERLAEYAGAFADETARHKVERVAFYYDDHRAACNARVLLPGAKKVFIVRHPVDRILSNFRASVNLKLSKALLPKPGAAGPLSKLDARNALDGVRAWAGAMCDALDTFDTGRGWTLADVLREAAPRGDSTDGSGKGPDWHLDPLRLTPRRDQPVSLAELASARLIAGSLYGAHYARWRAAGHPAHELCVAVLEDLLADYQGAVRALLKCVGVADPGEEWIAAHDFNVPWGSQWLLDYNAAGRQEAEDDAATFFRGHPKGPSGMGSLIAELGGFTLEWAVGQARPVLEDAVACYGGRLRARLAHLLFEDDVAHLRRGVRPGLDLEKLWGFGPDAGPGAEPEVSLSLSQATDSARARLGASPEPHLILDLNGTLGSADPPAPLEEDVLEERYL